MRFSVVLGVTLRLLVINISSSSPAINTAAFYQRCVITCDTLDVLHRRPRLQHLPVSALTQALKLDIGSESWFLPTPPAFDAAVRGVPVGVYPVWCGKTRMVWLSDGEKHWRYLYFRFDTMHERDRHTHRHTPYDGIGRAYAWRCAAIIVNIRFYRASAYWRAIANLSVRS